MRGIKPCPYCGGEVEMVKLVKRKEDKNDIYRIQCYTCKALVARGWGFPIETLSDAEDRIKQYKEYIGRTRNSKHSDHIRQSTIAKRRDRHDALGSRRSLDDEIYEIHDANQCNKNRGGWR